MIIGINASSALKENPTGVEEYTFQTVKHLAMIPESKEHRFVLYLNPMLSSERLRELEKLPSNFTLKFLGFPRIYPRLRFLWTQGRLAWEMIGAKIDVLFIPVHVLPLIHPKKTVVVIHGLEYEFFPELYSFAARHYIRFVTKHSLKKATKIISISESTKSDLIKIYGGDEKKITVIHHGVKRLPNIDRRASAATGHILYLGRLELKKNIFGIVGAYDKFREMNPNDGKKLVLAGGKGYGFSEIRARVEKSPFRKDIILAGYVSEEKKNDFLKDAAALLYPSFYEGFGMPVLEAQARGVPVVVSNVSSLPEVAGKGAVQVNPSDTDEIYKALNIVLKYESSRSNLIEEGFKNIEKFSWEKCARETLRALVSC